MSHPLVIFPDVVAETIDPLRTALTARPEPEVTGVQVHGRVPSPRPARLVVLRRDGGNADDVVTDRPRVTCQCWSDTEVDAERLAAITRAVLKTLPGTGAIRRVKDVGGPYPAPDPESDLPRYVFAVEITLRGDQ